MSNPRLRRLGALLTTMIATFAALLTTAGTASAQYPVPGDGGTVAAPAAPASLPAEVASSASTSFWTFVLVALAAALVAVVITEVAHRIAAHRHPAPAV